MKLFIYSTVMVSFVTLASFFVTWNPTDNYVVAFAFTALAFVTTFGFAFLFTSSGIKKLQVKWAQAVGVCLVQSSVQYGIMVGIAVGFGTLKVIIPATAMLTLAGLLLAPTAIKAVQARHAKLSV